MSEAKDKHFTDWESDFFGFGYGTGEPHVIPALKLFISGIGSEPYDYKILEEACGAVPAWLLINMFCAADLIEYGTSPRHGWLTPKGKALKEFVDAHDADALLAMTRRSYECDGHVHCYPDHCNCDSENDVCGNPFWGQNRTQTERESVK